MMGVPLAVFGKGALACHRSTLTVRWTWTIAVEIQMALRGRGNRGLWGPRGATGIC